MIATLSGRITDIEESSLILEVGGVGMRVNVPRPLLDEVQRGHTLALYTHLHLVSRQDTLALYGFKTKEERELFDLLLGAKGVGPRSALNILSTLSPGVIRRAVFQEQADVFRRAPGVGEKASQQILLHLKGKLEAVEGLETISGMGDADTEVLEALTTLGYSVVEAQAAIQIIPKDAPQDVEERLKLALQYFSKP